MTATREHRNAGRIEDAVAVIGATITVAEYLLDALAPALPDDFPTVGLYHELGELRTAHARVQEVLGV